MASRRRLDEPPRSPEEARDQIQRIDRAVERLVAQLRALSAEERALGEQRKTEEARAKAQRRKGSEPSAAAARRRQKIKTEILAVREKQNVVAETITHLEKCKATWQAEQYWQRKKEASKRAADSRLRRKEARRHQEWHRFLEAVDLNLNLPPELAVQVPRMPAMRDYPWADLERVSVWVCEWLLGVLGEIAANLGGVSFVYRYPESLEVDGRVIFRLPEDSDRSEDGARVADAFAPILRDVDFAFDKGATKEVVLTLYGHEIWVQSALITYWPKGRKIKSPDDKSRVLPGGIIESEMQSNWRRGDVAVPLETLWQIERDLREESEADREEGQEAEMRIGHFELRFHWNPSEGRPHRKRDGATETNCREALLDD